MQRPDGIRRVILVVIDGLRADAAPLFSLPTLMALAQRGVGTFAARTVTPSITSAAMTSLLTGITPRLHGIQTDRIGIPAPGEHLRPLPAHLAEHRLETRVLLATPPRPFRGLAERIGRRSGVTLRFGGGGAEEILATAIDDLTTMQTGFLMMHWPDVDRAGHSHGWASAAYRRAAQHADATLGRLVALTDPWLDAGTVLMVVADHGGGGKHPRNHDSQHPLDQTIPVVLAGAAVGQGELAPGTSLLDVPATIAWLLTGVVPAPYQGRRLVEAFVTTPSLVPV